MCSLADTISTSSRSTDRAIADFDKAIQLNPQHTMAYLGRDGAYGGKGDYDREIADETEAIRLNPPLANAYAGRGAAYGNKGDYDRAIADLDKGIRLKPDYAEGLLRPRLHLRRKGRLRPRLHHETEATRLSPLLANAYQKPRRRLARLRLRPTRHVVPASPIAGS